MKTCSTCKRTLVNAVFPKRKFARRCDDCIWVERVNRMLSLISIGRIRDTESVRDMVGQRASNVVDAAARSVGLTTSHLLYRERVDKLIRVVRAMPPYSIEEHLSLAGEGKGGRSISDIDAGENKLPWSHAGRRVYGVATGRSNHDGENASMDDGIWVSAESEVAV